MALQQSNHRWHTVLVTLLAGTLAALAGCGSPEEIPFDDAVLASINPLSDGVAFPDLDNDGNYPETYADTNGTKKNESQQSWAQLKGYIKAPIGDVWKALQDTQVVTDRAEISAQFLGECDPLSRGKAVVCLVFNNVPPGGFGSAFDYQITWRHEVIEGTLANPKAIRIEYQKTKGTVFIPILRGAVVIKKMFDQAGNDINVTSYAHLGELKEPQRPAERVRRWVPLMFNSVVAFVHRRPLPSGNS